MKISSSEMPLRPLSVLVNFFFFFFLPNAFSCPLMVWAASLIKVSSYFLMQLHLQLIYLFILVFSPALNGLWKVEKKIQSAFWRTLDSRINAGMCICIFLKAKRKRAFKKSNETDLRLIGLPALISFTFKILVF